MLLENVNRHERDSQIKFYEDSHVYKYYDQTFISVTTLIHTLFEIFNEEEVINRILASKNQSKKYKNKTFEDIQTMWKIQKETSLQAGLLLHKDIENYYNHEEIVNDSPEYQYFLNFVQDHRHLVPYRTEWQIFDEEYHIAGTIDMCFVDQGYITIFDWKRVRQISKENKFQKFAIKKELSHLPDNNFTHYALQLNIYRFILQKKYGKIVRDMFLVVLHPENRNENYILVPVPVMHKEVKIILNDLKKECSK
jgi:ATP-dependent exoDNAse (exonuclease V) beta subunit